MTIIGIDLGTTNCAVAWTAPRRPLRSFAIPQLVSAGDLAAHATLPSFLYRPTAAERDGGTLGLPWDAAPDWVAGVFAREQGALVPARQISSAKSWLSNAAVDRTLPLLPWGADEVSKISPVEASARLLRHLRDAWNHEHARDGDTLRLERLPIVLTVPASFDEEARELTVQAARDAGFETTVLLEEPLAALYAWIATHRRELTSHLADGALVLVCDVGGGTTDFTLVRTSARRGSLEFERIAIGEHLLLGGDNLDLALAAMVEDRVTGGDSQRLSLTQRHGLRRKCSAAKEQLLSEPTTASVRITLLGAGRGVVGGGLSAHLAQADVVGALVDGFLPLTAPDDLPGRERRIGLRELGLPFETEPAITRHLAAFLTRASGLAGGAGMARPDAVLFNGGFFTPAIARDRIVEALAAWLGQRPVVLENEHPESAVALGAAFYAKLRQDPEGSRRLLIRAGSARAYYIGVQSTAAGESSAVCVLPRGSDEGTAVALDRDLTVTTNQPAAFTLFSATSRSDAAGDVVAFASADETIHRHAPLITAFRFGRRSRREPLSVRVRAIFTETGTLELWCDSTTTEHRWRLAFNLRHAELDPLEGDETPDDASEDRVVVGDAARASAERLIRDAFGTGAAPATMGALVGDLENALGHSKASWPLDVIRRLADVLLEVGDARKGSAAAEARWLNLTGFCMRPGFGAPADPWRVSELRKVYAAGLTFPRDVQCQVEWIVLWQRVGGGFSTGQQRELAQRIVGQLGVGQKKPPRLNAQVEREGWRLLGSLERLDAGQRVRLGDEVVERLRKDQANPARLWTLGRLGARIPLYGPLNSVVAPPVAERWLAVLLAAKALTTDGIAAAVQIAARTDDPARDISDAVRAAALSRLTDLGVPPGALQPVREMTAVNRVEASRAFGESLPEGLSLGVAQPPV